MLRRLFRYIRALPRLYTIGGAAVIVVVALIGIHAATRGGAAPATPPEVTHVHVASVASLTSASGPLPVTGKVSSLSQATILAQSSGEITVLNRAIGDRVGAGSVIAQFENSSQLAAVLQAQGSYDAAAAALAKASGSTATNSGIASGQATTAAQNAKTTLVTALQSANTALDDAVHTKSDPLFNNPRSVLPTLAGITIPDGQLIVDIQNNRVSIEQSLVRASEKANGDGDVDANATAVTAEAQLVLSFLGDLIKAINKAIPNSTVTASMIVADQTALSAARSEVLTAVSALATAKNAYDAAQTAVETSANTAGSGTQSDIASAQAQVKVAQGALNGARANLEKTIIRSPINGTIVSLAITRGDFVSTFAQVAQVSNPSALQVDTYVTPDDAKTLAVGGKAVIDQDVSGVITSIAPALDPTTGKIPVKVGITGDQNKLTDGDTVTVSLSRTVSPATQSAAAASSSILIPIISAKITPQGAVVFGVSSSTLIAIPVTLGAIRGDQVTVTTGLSQESVIVTDARGLSNGQVVVVD